MGDFQSACAWKTTSLDKMKEDMKLKILLLIFAFGLIASEFFVYNEITKLRSATAMNYVPKSTFKRSELISKVSDGDGSAALELAHYYESHDLPEAAFYWYGVALKLGSSKVDQSFLDFYEHTIIGQYDTAPYKEPSPK